MSLTPEPTSESAGASPKKVGPTSATKTDRAESGGRLRRKVMTPLLAENEAKRGDTMLRWALLFLIALAACTEITETSTLMHVACGQNTLENFFPARTGVLSSTAENQSWHNLSWLFDSLLAISFSIAGGAGLSLLTMGIALFTFGVMIATNHSRVSSWWSTICGTLAFLACVPLLTALPEIITLFGLALTLRLLHRWKETGHRKFLYGLVGLFVVWSNCDPYLFLGIAVLALYAVGEFLGDWWGLDTGLPNNAARRTLWLTVGAVVVASLVNPFGWHSLLSPFSLYGSEYPAFRELLSTTVTLRNLPYYSMTIPEFWELLNHHLITGLLLLLTMFVTFGLNFRRLDWGYLFVGIGMSLFAVVTVHELAAASVVAAVLSTLNAQQWYQHRFRQTYSAKFNELLFSRGGRAVTVLTLFVLAFLAMNGRFSRPVGLGLTANLQASVDGLKDELKDSYDDHPFHFVVSQGDLLIWNGQKSFIDSRLGLYSRMPGIDGFTVDKEQEKLQQEKEATQFIAQFQATRRHLQAADHAGDAGRKWQRFLDHYQITHVMPRLDPRLTGASPDFQTYLALSQSADWELVSFGATSAIFYRTDSLKPIFGNTLLEPDQNLADFIKQNRFDFTEQAFRVSSDDLGADDSDFDLEDSTKRISWASLPVEEPIFSFGRLFPKTEVTNGHLLAEHYHQLITLLIEKQLTPKNVRRQLAACLYLLIREANRRLNVNSQDVSMYRLLGRSYALLGVLETDTIPKFHPRDRRVPQWKRIVTGQSAERLRTRRSYQALCAFRQSLVIEPDDLETLRAVANIYYRLGYWDWELAGRARCIKVAAETEQLETLSEADRASAEKNREIDQQRHDQLKKQLQPIFDELKKVDEQIKEKKFVPNQYGNVIKILIQQGCRRRALQFLEEQNDWVMQIPEAMNLHVQFLLEAGDLQKASDQFDVYQSRSQVLQGRSEWKNLHAQILLCRAEYATAKEVWLRIAGDLELSRFDRITGESPFTIHWFSQARNQYELVEEALFFTPYDISNYQLQAALCDLEIGRPAAAFETFQESLKSAPNSPARDIIRFYWEMLSQEKIPRLVIPSAKSMLPIVAPKPRRVGQAKTGR